MLVYRFMKDVELRSLYNQFAQKGFAVPTGAESHEFERNTFSKWDAMQKNFWFFCTLEDAAKAINYFCPEDDYTLVEFNLEEDTMSFGCGYYGRNMFSGIPNVHECICQKVPSYAITGRIYEPVWDEKWVETEDYADYENICIGFVAPTA